MMTNGMKSTISYTIMESSQPNTSEIEISTCLKH